MRGDSRWRIPGSRRGAPARPRALRRRGRPPREGAGARPTPDRPEQRRRARGPVLRAGLAQESPLPARRRAHSQVLRRARPALRRVRQGSRRVGGGGPAAARAGRRAGAGQRGGGQADRRARAARARAARGRPRSAPLASNGDRRLSGGLRRARERDARADRAHERRGEARRGAGERPRLELEEGTTLDADRLLVCAASIPIALHARPGSPPPRESCRSAASTGDCGRSAPTSYAASSTPFPTRRCPSSGSTSREPWTSRCSWGRTRCSRSLARAIAGVTSTPVTSGTRCPGPACGA